MYIRCLQLLAPQRRVRWAGAAGDTPVGFIHCVVGGRYMYYLSKSETNILFVTRYSINLVNGVNWVIKFLFLKDFIYNIIKESHLSSKTMCKSYQIIKL